MQVVNLGLNKVSSLQQESSFRTITVA